MQADPLGNTIIVIATDFGQSFGPDFSDHADPQSTGLYEESLRTFFIVYDPLGDVDDVHTKADVNSKSLYFL